MLVRDVIQELSKLPPDSEPVFAIGVGGLDRLRRIFPVGLTARGEFLFDSIFDWDAHEIQPLSEELKSMITGLILASEKEKHTDRVLCYKNGSVASAVVWSSVLQDWQAASVAGGEFRHAVSLLKDRLSEHGDHRDLPVFDGLTFQLESPTMQSPQDKGATDDSGRTEEQPAMAGDAGTGRGEIPA